jgi:hypothetical protein
MAIPEKKLIQISQIITTLIIGMFLMMPCIVEEISEGTMEIPPLLTYEQFKEQAFQETFNGVPTGISILDGDTPVDSEDRMLQIYNDYVTAYNYANLHSIVYNINGADILWNATDKLQGTSKNRLKTVMFSQK